MKMSIVRFTALFCAVSVLFVLSVLALSEQLDQLVPPILPKDSPSVKDEGKKVLILDAGHGGEDGGASGVNGTLEKELNLQYALAANDLLSACGFKVLLTRSDDRMLGDGEKGHKKLADLRYRLNLANSHPEALLISLHMNKFPQEYCKGIQLYYSPNNGESLPLAQALHRLVKDFQKDNNREIKEATSAIYLLDRVQIPGILVECGFLSNNEEASLLKTEGYRKKLSVLLLGALSDYCSPNDRV